MREIIESARTVEQAIQAACEKLGVERDEANIEILQFPKKGFLGFVSAANMAKVRVTVGEEEVEVKAEAPKAAAAPV
ncbi:Jag N-terminal domain-containing protein, partial [Akkermansia muciniphila]|uniref:Jag N-terminal domain-containing protein n=1 Tax=Akkermansia muciniphila TaxID=239935 RepID=UPI0012542E32